MDGQEVKDEARIHFQTMRRGTLNGKIIKAGGGGLGEMTPHSRSSLSRTFLHVGGLRRPVSLIKR